MKVIYSFMLIILCSYYVFSQEESLSDQLTHGFIDNNGVRLHYVTTGKGPLIVMIHGFPDFWYTWRNQMKVLSKDYQVVAIDLRGYNSSDKPAGVENYAMRHLIGDVGAVIDYFPQKKATIIGHDWGGAIAWQVAIWRPGLVERLIVLSTPHPNGLTREISNNKQQKKNSEYARNFQKENAHENLTSTGLAKWVNDSVAKKLYVEAFDRSNFESMLNYYKANFPSANKSQQLTVTKTISTRPQKKVLCPTLGIFGLEDKALLPSGWNGTWDYVEGNLTLVSIPNAGHFIQHDASDLVTRTIVKWLK